MRLDTSPLGLADLDEEIGEPALVDIERFTAFDAGERDRAHDITVVLVKSGDAADSLKGGFRGLGTTGFDELKIIRVRRGAAGEITTLLHEEFLCAEFVLELAREPLTDVN